MTADINTDFSLYKRVLDISTIVYDDIMIRTEIYANDTENQLHNDEDIEPQTPNVLMAMQGDKYKQ